MTALSDALRASKTERARSLLAAGADPNGIEPVSGECPLQVAIKDILDPAARNCAVRYLLAYGAVPECSNGDSTGPLYLALMHRDARVLELLLRYGSDPKAQSGPGDRGLLQCALLDYSLDTYAGRLPELLDSATRDDPDALIEFLNHLAVRQRKPRPECLELLRLYGADWSRPARVSESNFNGNFARWDDENLKQQVNIKWDTSEKTLQRTQAADAPRSLHLTAEACQLSGQSRAKSWFAVGLIHSIPCKPTRYSKALPTNRVLTYSQMQR
jgi:ankyrin repeat protein